MTTPLSVTPETISPDQLAGVRTAQAAGEYSRSMGEQGFSVKMAAQQAAHERALEAIRKFQEAVREARKGRLVSNLLTLAGAVVGGAAGGWGLAALGAQVGGLGGAAGGQPAGPEFQQIPALLGAIESWRSTQPIYPGIKEPEQKLPWEED